MERKAIQNHILPGYSFQISKKRHFGKKIYHKFKYGNPLIELEPLWGTPNNIECVSEFKIDPLLIYGVLKRPNAKTTVPQCIQYHGMTAVFKGCIIPSFESLNEVDLRDVKKNNENELCSLVNQSFVDKIVLEDDNETSESISNNKFHPNQDSPTVHSMVKEGVSGPQHDNSHESNVTDLVKNKEKMHDNIKITDKMNTKEFLNGQNKSESNREVVLIYYLEDDSVEVKENILNSTRTIVKRGKLFKRDNIESKLKTDYTWRELNVGMDINAEELKMHITSCNDSTRRFFKEQGIDLNENESVFHCEGNSHNVQYKVSLCGEQFL